jgi:hypothetical protein
VIGSSPALRLLAGSWATVGEPLKYHRSFKTNLRRGAADRSESELVRDLVQEGIPQAMQVEALKNIRFLINTAWIAVIITPGVLALILWRAW